MRTYMEPTLFSPKEYELIHGIANLTIRENAEREPAVNVSTPYGLKNSRGRRGARVSLSLS